jgi:MoaA/NifB/PqqE/SkfB family radical SAM enzyme
MQPTHQGVLQIEPTDHCNLSCRMCAPHHEAWDEVHGVAKGTMDMGLYSDILDGLVEDDCRFDHIIFQWLGDPSLHPELPAMLAQASEKLRGRVGYLRVDTNGIRLPPHRMDALLSAVHPELPFLVVFTLDAQTAKTYEAVKGVDALERVRKNIRYLIRRRSQTGAALNIQLQFVVQPGNDHEAGDFLQYWADLLDCQGGDQWHDELMFKRLSVGGGADGQAAADGLYEDTMERFGIRAGRVGGATVVVWESRPWQEDDGHSGERGACPGLWLTPVIRHDGALMMCCADLQGELTLGNVAEHGFRALWDGPRATQLRLDHLAGRFDGVCAGCGGINWYQLTDEMTQTARDRAVVLGLD